MFKQGTKMKRLAIGIAIAIPLLVVAGTFWSQNRGGDIKQRVIIAQVSDFFLYAPIYVAKDAGFFEEQGLDVSIISTGGDEKSWAAVISGSAQFGVGDPTFVAISDQQGQRGTVIASIVNGVPFWGVTLRTDIPAITKPVQLRGLSVATFPAPSTAYTLQREMFTRGGLEPSIRQGAFGALIPMLKAGQADIALELEPNVSIAVEGQGAHVVYSLANLYGDFAITGLTARPQYLRENSETTGRIVCALRKALDFIHTKNTETLAILKKRFPELSGSVPLNALRRVQSEGIIPKQVAVDANAWKKAIDLRISVGDLKSAKPMNYYVDNSFADIADKTCGVTP